MKNYEITVQQIENGRLRLGVVFNEALNVPVMYVELLSEEEVVDVEGYHDAFLMDQEELSVEDIMKCIGVRGAMNEQSNITLEY